jgi:hypothetical protein
MIKKSFLLLTATILFTACAQQDVENAKSEAPNLPQDGIEFVDIWARPANTGGNTAVYMEIRNGSAAADTLIGLQSEAAALVELHESYETDDGMMGMRPASDPTVPARGVKQYRPGGLHIMIMGLNRDLRAGDEFPLILNFASHGADTLTVPVQVMGGS